MAGKEAKGARDLGIESDKQLRKALGKFELLFLSIGGIIGSGWLFASLDAAAYAGSGAILGWIIAWILIMFIGLAFAEIASAIPKSGGIARYPHYTHGGWVGFIMSWAYFIVAISTPPLEAEAVTEYIGSFSPKLSSLLVTTGTFNGTTVTILTPVGLGIAVLLMLFFFFLNYLGVKALGEASHGVGWWKLLIPTITVILLLALSFHPSNFTLGGGFFPSAQYVAGGSAGIAGIAAVFYAIPTTGILFAYTGFRQSVEYGGEGKNPGKDIPLALIGSLSIALVLYVLLQTSFIGAINWNALYLNESGKLVPVTPGNWSALSTAVTKSGIQVASGPFFTLLRIAPVAGLAALILLGWSYILMIDAVVSPSGTGWIYLGTATRSFYALAANGYLPGFFLKIGKTRIPIYALIASLILGIIFLLPFPSWYEIVGLNTSATVVNYIMSGITLGVLRKTAPDLKRPYKLPAASVIAPLATLAAGLMLYWSGFGVLFYVYTTVFLGIPIFMFFYASKWLGIKRSTATTIGIVDLAIDLGLAFYLFYATSGLSHANNIAFAIYYIIIAAMFIGTTAFLAYAAPKEVKREINAGWWAVIYLLIIYLLSYFGAFGLNTVIPFPWDTIIAAIITLGFHFWAVHSGFRTEAIEEIIEEQKRQVKL